MGLERLPRLCAGLIGAGLAETTPAAVVSRGTLPDQEVVTATLAGLPVAAADLGSPALIVVGDVVAVGTTIAEHTGGRLRQRAAAAIG